MSHAIGWRRFVALQPDVRALALVVLFTTVLSASVMLAPTFQATPGVNTVTDTASTGEQAAGGLGVSLLTVIEATILLGIIALFRRTPNWLQPVLRRTVATTFWVGMGLYGAFIFGVPGGLAAAGLAYFIVHATDALGVYWVVNDAIAIGLAIYFGAAAGVIAGPVLLGVMLVGLSVYDHVFANRADWMFSLARATVRWRLPALVVLPVGTWRLPWTDLAEFSTDDEDAKVAHGIGTADLALPAAFVAAVSIYTSAWVAGIVAGGVLIACLHLSWSIEHRGSGAGMPPLTAGALGGWAVAVAAMGVVG